MFPKMIQAKSKSKWNDKIYCRRLMNKFYHNQSSNLDPVHVNRWTGKTNGHCHFSFHNKHKKCDKPTLKKQ